MTQTRALAAWWAGLDEGRRATALDLQPGQHLPADLADTLVQHGVRVPTACVVWDAAGVQLRRTLHVQPGALTDFLAGVRAWSCAAA
ncbi:hypothetical protein [Kineococcus terrestris]|uniref:hypothetical protein n=1 Tax=Kineococcus terrestris TaxID=2044856 RepID=UPI0034DB39D1